MSWIFSSEDLAVMDRVRRAFDPSGLLNPGKILPAPAGCADTPARAAGLHGLSELWI